jgi:hypothetical protein
VTLEGRKAVRRCVRKAVDSYTLSEADESTDYDGCGTRYLGAAEWNLDM